MHGPEVCLLMDAGSVFGFRACGARLKVLCGLLLATQRWQLVDHIRSPLAPLAAQNFRIGPKVSQLPDGTGPGTGEVQGELGPRSEPHIGPRSGYGHGLDSAFSNRKVQSNHTT